MNAAAPSYCAYVLQEQCSPLHVEYHDTEYGYPLDSDNALFERMCLEINQAGLSWLTILKKRYHFRDAFHGFDIATVANYDDNDVQRLMSDQSIIRNRLKIMAVIHNAGVIRSLQQEHGTFMNWLNAHHPLSKTEWTKLFKKTFKFTGGEIVNEFLMSTGYLEGAHREDCPIHAHILTLSPRWANPD
ncbi:MAG: DNA-3-methyladenine glycosylase I [Candidatus Kapaibacteriota bacterium]|jgi:DNA-3-methyladenine glycosylase I